MTILLNSGTKVPTVIPNVITYSLPAEGIRITVKKDNIIKSNIHYKLKETGVKHSILEFNNIDSYTILK